MDRQVIIRDNQAVPAEDFMRVQDFARGGFDDLVKHAVASGQAYAGFETASSGTFEITSLPGIYLSAGVLYARRTNFVRDLANDAPAVNKRIVALVAWGVQEDQDPVARDFIVNLQTEETEAQQVYIERARNAELGTIKGAESPDPQKPTVPLDQLVIAWVTMTPTGIEAIEMNLAGRLSSVQKNHARLNDIEAWKDLVDPRISTLATDVSNLSVASSSAVDRNDLFRVNADIARLKELAEIPDDYAQYGADRFLTTDETDTGDVNLLALVEEGVRFSDANANDAELALYSSINSNLTVTNGLVLPKFSSALRLSVTGYVGEQAISQYSQAEHTIIQRTMSRERIRWGQTFAVCTNAAWWRSGVYDPADNIFRKDGELFEVLEGDPTTNHRVVRVRQFWVDRWEEPYWEVLTTTHVIQGSQIAQTFLNAQAGWLTGIDLYFTQRGAAGDVTVSVCELTPSGTPDLTKTIAQQTLDILDLKAFPLATTVSLMPTYLKSGKRYAVVVTTQGAHSVAMADGSAYLGGTFFTNQDGAYFAGNLFRDMMFGLRYARFESSRTVAQLQPFNLDGGIAAIDILASMVVPDACGLLFEVEIPGEGWTPADQVSVNKLIGLPPLLNARMVFQGTPDLHAGIQLPGSRIRTRRPRTTFKHISTDRVLAAATDTIDVQITMADWNAANHTCTITLETAGGTETADVVEDTDLGGGRLARKASFALDAPVTSFQIVIDGTTTSALAPFLIEERVDVEF